MITSFFRRLLVAALAIGLSGLNLAWPAATMAARDAYATIEAESADDWSGVNVEPDCCVGGFHGGDWLRYNAVDFSTGANQFTINIALPSYGDGNQMELRLDSLSGPIIGTLTVRSTGSWDDYTDQSTSVSGASGTHDLYIVGVGGPDKSIANLDYFWFTKAPAGNNPPSVSITSPANGAKFQSGATVTITAAASDSDGTVSKVEFFADGSFLGSDPSAPYSYNWVNAPVGSHSLTAKATDNGGATKTSDPVSITVESAAGGAEAVVWTSLVRVATFGASNNGLKKSSGCDGCADAGAVSQQQIASGDGYVEFTASDTNSQRSVGLNNSNTGTGAAELDFYFKLWNTGPYADIFENNTYISRHTYALNDVLRIAYESGQVKYYKNGVLLYTSAKAPVYPAFADASLWSYNPGAGVAASIGNAMINFGSSPPPPPPPPNQAPSVSITKPVNGASFAKGTTIVIEATASDSDGTVNKVEFFADGGYLGTDYDPPYSYNWVNAAVGSHSLTAKATDDKGATANSSAVSVTVTADDPTVVTDKKVYSIPNPPALPAAGGTFTDPVFKRTIMRLTDSRNGSHCRIAYSYWPSFNANNTKFHAYCDSAPDGKGPRLFNFDPANFKLLSHEPLFAAKPPSGRNANWEDSIWSSSDPSVLFLNDYYNLYSYNVATKVYTLVKDLRSLMGSGNNVWQMSKSDNNDVFAFTERNSSNKRVGFFVYKRSTNQRLYRQTSLPLPLDEVQIDKTGRYLVIKYEGSTPKVASQVVVEIRDLNTGVKTGLTAGSPDYAPGHSDNGTGTVVGWGDWVNAILKRSLSTPHQYTNLLGFANDWYSHNVSALATNEGWNLVSTYGSAGVTGLFRDEIFQVAADGSGKVRRLAHHHAVLNGNYFNQPNGNISRDGKLAAFTSNWGNGTGRRDVFIIKVPPAP